MNQTVNSINMKEKDADLDLATCMASESDSSSQPLPEVSDVKTSTSTATEQINIDSSFAKPTPIVSSSNEVPNLPKTATSAPNSLQNGGTGNWGFAQIANGFGLNLGQRTLASLSI
ncbi:hypothetical protein Tco_0692641 [Tanacetum coccineum]